MRSSGLYLIVFMFHALSVLPGFMNGSRQFFFCGVEKS